MPEEGMLLRVTISLCFMGKELAELWVQLGSLLL